jgi:hypothetical protein
MMYVIICLPFQHLLENFCFFHFIFFSNQNENFLWIPTIDDDERKKDMSKIFVSIRHTTSSSFRACDSNKDIHKVWFHGVNALYHWKHGPQLKTWGTTNNMMQKWNIGGKDRVKFWNATKPPSFWVSAHAQHLKGVIIVRKPNVRSSLRLGHKNGRSEPFNP